MKLKKILICCLSLMIMNEAKASSTSITTLQLIKSAANAKCIDYKVVGTCFWLKCHGYKCSIRTSIKVRHFLPDLVVSGYPQSGETPWEEVQLIQKMSNPINKVVDALVGFGADAGGDTNIRHVSNHTKLKFKEVDAYGHPGGSLLSQLLGSLGYFCENGITPLFPYYLSTNDLLSWRTGGADMFTVAALKPGSREIGSRAAQNMWGNIYPRAGAVTQTDDTKAGAVMVQRAADLITGPQELGRIFFSPNKGKSQGFWPPEQVKENDKSNHKWQQLAPKMGKTCDIFPSLYQEQSDDGKYSYALWRPYACCKKKGQKLLYVINF